MRTTRVDVPAARLGLTPPPSPVQCWWLQHDPVRLYLVTTPGRAEPVRRWLETNGVAEVEVEESLSSRTLWARIDVPPRAWARLLSNPGLRRADLLDSGAATLILECPSPVPDQTMARDLADLAPASRCRGALTPRVDLTHRQREVMAAAVALGFYEVPRLASVRDVAAAVGLSPAATSELLRRGERILIAGHFDQTGVYEQHAPFWVSRVDNRPALLVPERVRVAPP